MTTNHPRNEIQEHPEYNLSNQLLQHQLEMLQFLYYTEYDIIYETFELKHAAYLQKKRGEVVKKFKSQQIARHFEIASERVHIRILRDDIDLDKHLSRLELLWHNKNIPFFHRFYFQKYIFTTYFKNLQKLISAQEKLMKQQQHIYFSIFRAINAREACLRQLRRNLAELTPQDVYEYIHVAKERLYAEKRKQQQQKYKIQGYKIKMIVDKRQGNLGKTKFEMFSDLFNHLTKLTLYVIQLIIKWRQYIYSLTHDPRKKKERIQYYFYDDNYFLKSLGDLGFLRASFLANFYDFAPKNDPFMFRPILAFEKRQEKTLQNQLLKQIFMPEAENLAQIMSKLEYLSEEYKNNIRSRRVYDLNALKKPLKIEEEKHIRNHSPKQPISNLVLKKIQSPIRESKSLKTFRIKDRSVKKENQKIVVEFKNSPKTRKKKLVSIPGTQQKMIIERQTSPVKNSVILQKHPTNENVEKLIDSKLLGALKEEVIKKIKQEFALETREQFKKNQALQMYIDSKVKDAVKSVFPYEPEKNLKEPIQFTTLSIPEEQVSAQLTKIFKKAIFRFHDMQLHEGPLLKKIQNSQFCYFVRANIGEEEIGQIICTLDRDITDYKALKILYIGFYDLSQLEMLVLQFVEFLWKYQNSYEIIYSFTLPANNEPIQELLTTLQKNLQHNCIVVIKQVYSSVAQYRYVFKRKHKNINYIPNKHPVSLHLTLSALIGEKKLMLQNSSNKKKPQFICYDYLLMDILRKYIASDDFVILKEKVKWKDRLKLLLDFIIEVEKTKGMMVPIKITQAQNVSQMNKILSKKHQILMQVSDLVKTNLLKLLKMQLNLTLPFLAKSVYDKDHVQYYRYSLNQKIQYLATNTNEFYFFPTNQIKDMILVYFSAKQFLALQDTSQQNLSLYLKRHLGSADLYEKEVYNFWVPMFRYPQKYQERQDIYLPTHRVEDLFPIKKDLLIGEKAEYFCNMEMQNGIRYQKTKLDITIEKPYGIAAMIGEQRFMIYGRIITI